METQQARERWNRTRLSETLGIEYPIIQGPLGGMASQKLTAAVSNFGGLGSFGAMGLSAGAVREVIAAFALGAEGVQIGTAFLTCEGSGASLPHREMLLSGRAGETGLTKGFTGRLARGVRNQLMEEINRPGVEILPYPLQRALVRNLSIPAEEACNAELLPLWAGQSANLSHYVDAEDLLNKLVSDVSEIAGDVVQWSTGSVEFDEAVTGSIWKT